MSWVPTLTLRMPAATAAARPSSRHARRAVQHQRHRHGVAEPRDQVDVELRRALGHRVRGADGDGEAVDAGGGDERGGLGRVGAHAGRVGAVLAADLAELGLDPDALLVHRARRPRAVGATFSAYGSVEASNMTEPKPRSAACSTSASVLAVVEVEPDRHRAASASARHAGGDRREAAVEAHRVVADREHHRAARRARPPATIPSAYSSVMTLKAATAGRLAPVLRRQRGGRWRSACLDVHPRGAECVEHGGVRTARR